MTPKRSRQKRAYEFKPESLEAIRNRLKVSQATMAKEFLGVPVNTLWRWERGDTAPDANDLAIIYSIAREHGITPSFFGARREPGDVRKARQTLSVMWDFRSLGVPAWQVPDADAAVREEVERRFGSTARRLFKAFVTPFQAAAADALDKQWRVWENDRDLDEEIIDQARSDAGQDPGGTILMLMTRDTGLGDLIDELRADGVRVYLMAPDNADQGLIGKVGRRRWIPWNRTDFTFWLGH